jgi:glyoxylase-like metal-dependent hydrolase (beta-lactamase superfamily II)
MPLPVHLAQDQASGISLQEPVAQFEIGSYRNFVYLILDWDSKKAAVIDPQSHLKPLLQSLLTHGFDLSAILLTHTHFDHIAGLPELHKQFPQIPVYVHSIDAHRIPSQLARKLKLEFIQDQQNIPLGTLKIQTLHTPGHSAGECCFRLDANRTYLFTGDTIFIRDCGRTDLESGSDAEMFTSIQEIKKLPPETVILPGHHYKKECASDLQTELKDSPPFQCKTIDELANLP